MIATASRTLVSGFSKGTSFQRSTMTFDEDGPSPRTKRPRETSARAAACWASSAGPRVKGLTMPVHSRIRSVWMAATASGVKPSWPLVSALQRSS
jgi:hypothetical protein